MRRRRSISLAVVFVLGALVAVIVPSAPAASPRTTATVIDPKIVKPPSD
jgi:hypothetical protein